MRWQLQSLLVENVIMVIKYLMSDSRLFTFCKLTIYLHASGSSFNLLHSRYKSLISLT